MATTTVTGTSPDGTTSFTNSSTYNFNNPAPGADPLPYCLTNVNDGPVRASLVNDDYYMPEWFLSAGAGEYISAFDAGTEIWHTPLSSDPTAASSTGQIVAGTDGTVYDSYTVESGDDTVETYFLAAFNPLTGARLWTHSLPAVPNVQMFATTHGVVVISGGSLVTWWASDGSIRGQRTIPNPEGHRLTVAAGAADVVDYAVDGTNSTNSDCGATGGSVGAVSLTSAADTPVWSANLPLSLCSPFVSATPLPDGAAVYTSLLGLVGAGPGPTGGGVLLWNRAVDLAATETAVYSDDVGQVMVPGELNVPCPNDTTDVCQSPETTLVNGQTGQTDGGVLDNDTVKNLYTQTTPGDGIVYLMLGGTDEPSGQGFRSLVAEPLADFGKPWPESALAAAAGSPTGPTGPPAGVPTFKSAQIGAPASTDPLLTRRLTLTPAAGSAAATSFTYGWRAPGSQAAAPTLGLQTCTNTAGQCTVDYWATQPSQSGWTLMAQAVNAAGPGPWMKAVSAAGNTSITTPSRPVLIALGDSITAGHHRLTNTAPTTCTDPSFGYPQYVWNRIENKLPPQWRGSGYHNYARSGFSTTDIIDGGPTAVDACHKSYPGPSELAQAETLLKTKRSTWIEVVLTAGINDTNWVSKMTTIALKSALGVSPAYGLTQCTADMRTWNGWTLPTKTMNNFDTIIDGVESAADGDPNAAVAWIGYYNTAPNATGYPPVPTSCGAPFEKAVGALNGQIRAALGTRRYTWVDTGSTMDQNVSRIQPWLASDVVLTPAGLEAAGWPHPNSAGAAAIGALVPLF